MTSRKEEKLYEEYKRIENHCNRKMLNMINCTQFLLLMQEMMDQHLDDVQAQRSAVQQWLMGVGVPNKEIGRAHV